jgi:uncharacterized peroxidase-related enzyme
MMAHSLRPHSMEGHMALYKNVLHHSSNQLPTWFLETLGVYVSMLNECDYCVNHHAAGLRRLLADDTRADEMLESLKQAKFAGAFTIAETCALAYARCLTRDPSAVSESMLEGMRQHGYDDGMILEINQVCAYFAYANRTVLGLGCRSDGEVLGQSPGSLDDPGDWSHG